MEGRLVSVNLARPCAFPGGVDIISFAVLNKNNWK